MRTTVLALLLTASLLPAAFAGTEIFSKETVPVAVTPFDKGRLELQSASGAFFSIGGSGRQTLNYSSTAYRFGVMLNDPSGDGGLRGNWEFLFQVFGGSVFDGPGNALGGAALLLRYNFVPMGARWSPYVQLGGGGVYNDIYKDHDQRLIGAAWEFDLEAALGFRYLLSDSWSLSLEGGYRHISNANTASRNVGLNSLGATLGLGYHF